MALSSGVHSAAVTQARQLAVDVLDAWQMTAMLNHATLLGRKTIHIVGTEEVTQVVDGEDAHCLDVAAAFRPKEVVGDRGLAVEPDNAVGDEHLLTHVSVVRLVVRKVCRLEFSIRV